MFENKQYFVGQKKPFYPHVEFNWSLHFKYTFGHVG